MATLRRLYFYGVALIALETWQWALVALLTKVLEGGVWQPQDLAGSLSAFLIGLLVFGLHWRWAQREAAADPEENASAVRIWALYFALALTWGVVFHAVAAGAGEALSRLLPVEASSLWPSTSWARVVAMLIPHTLMGWYFARLVAAYEGSMTVEQATARRWYRYLWFSYGILWVLLGAYQLISALVPPRGAMPWEMTRYAAQGALWAVGGVVLLGVWGRRWWRETLTDAREASSVVVAGFLSVWLLAGLAVSLAMLGNALYHLLMVLLGEEKELYAVARLLLTVGVPWLLLWLSASYGLMVFLKSWQPERRAVVYRWVWSVVAYVGVIVVSLGVGGLISYISEVLLGEGLSYEGLASGVAFLIIGVPLWWFPWRALQADATADEEARRSVLRRGYLYLVLFVAVMGAMGFATDVVFQLLRAALGGRFSADNFAFALGMLLWATGVLAYHARLVLAERRQEAAHRAEAAPWRALVLALPGAAWVAALPAEQGRLRLTVVSPTEAPPESADFQAVVLSAETLAGLSPQWQAWLAAFEGQRVLVPADAARWVWGGAGQLPKVLDALAAGKRPPDCHTSILWKALGYVGIFAMISWVLGMLLSLFIGLALGAD